MADKRWGGLRLRILAWSFVPTMIILVTVAVVMFYAYQAVTGDLVVERDREVTRLAAGQVATEMEEYVDLLDAEARRTPLASNDPAAQRAGLQQARNRLSVFDGGAVILNTYGTVVAAEPERPEILGQDWSDRPFYRQILLSETLASPEAVFSNLVPDGPGGSEVIAIAVPIRSPQGGIVGAIAGMFRVGQDVSNAFYGDLLKLRLAESGLALLVDGQGRGLFQSGQGTTFFGGGDLSMLDDVQQVMDGRTGALRTRDPAGQDIVASFAPVPGTPWGVVHHEYWQTVIRAGQGYRRILLLLLALGVMVPALVVMVGVQRITKPMKELIGAAQKVAGGDFGQILSAPTGDEIEELAQQFNIMSARLQESYRQLAERAEARTQELAAVNEIAAVVSQSLNLDEILNAALRRTLSVLECESGGIYLLEQDGDGLTIAASRGFSAELIGEIDHLRVGEGFSGRVVQSGEPLVVRNVSDDARLTRLAVSKEGFRSLASVPLSCKGRAVGTLFALTRGYREFTDQNVELLMSIGHQVGIAVENARLFGQATQRLEELETLYHAERRRSEQFRVIGEVGRQITSILEVDELLHQVARLIQEAFGYYHVGIGMIEGDEVVYQIGAGMLVDDPSFRFWPARLKVGKEGLSGWVAASGQSMVVGDVMRDPRYVWMRGSKTRSELLVPITVKGQVFGVLDVQSEHKQAFDQADLALLESLANQAAIAIENARLYEQAQQVAVMEERNRLARDLHDAVTQTLFSASLISEALPELWEKDQAEGRALLGELQRLSRGALAEMRTLLLELRPAALMEANLATLLRQLGEATMGRTGLPVVVTVEWYCALPADVHVTLYRIAQEALNNVVKHANAKQVTVHLRCTGTGGDVGPVEAIGAELTVTDDGRGFDPACVPSERLGLEILRERSEAIGAQLTIDSKPGEGTRVRVTWRARDRDSRGNASGSRRASSSVAGEGESTPPRADQAEDPPPSPGKAERKGRRG